VLRTDGGGVARAALNEVSGADRVGRFLTGIVSKRPDLQLRETETSEGPALAMHENGHVVGIITLEVTPDGITSVNMLLNPNKLTRWN
jgi:hypothetical protein